MYFTSILTKRFPYLFSSNPSIEFLFLHLEFLSFFVIGACFALGIDSEICSMAGKALRGLALALPSSLVSLPSLFRSHWLSRA